MILNGPVGIGGNTPNYPLDVKGDINCQGTVHVKGINLPPVYANNAAAAAGGLTVGQLYRTGADPDFLAVVH
jgi:hypothetical protein